MNKNRNDYSSVDKMNAPSLYYLQHPTNTLVQPNTHGNPIRYQLDFGTVPLNPDGSNIINSVVISLFLSGPSGMTGNLILQNVDTIPSDLGTIETMSSGEVLIRIAKLNQELGVVYEVISPLPSSAATDINNPILNVTIVYRVGSGNRESYWNGYNIEVSKPLLLNTFYSNMPNPINLDCTSLDQVDILYTMNYENRGLYGLTATIQFNFNINVDPLDLSHTVISFLAAGQPEWSFVNNGSYITTFFIAGTNDFNNPVLGSKQIIITVFSNPSAQLPKSFAINQLAIITGIYPNGFQTRSSSGPPDSNLTSPQTIINFACPTSITNSSGNIIITFIPNNQTKVKPKESKLQIKVKPKESKSDKDPFVICACKHRK